MKGLIPHVFRLAVIDLGSNAVRMEIFETSNRTHFKSVKYTRKPLRLGASVFNSKIIPRSDINAAVEFFSHFRDVINKYKVDKVMAVATSALREAQNKNDFIKEILNRTGIEIVTISGEEEAEYIFKAVIHKLNLENNNCLIFDIGGGSIEFTLSGPMLSNRHSFSVPFGMIRALNLMRSKNISDLDIGTIKNYFSPTLKILESELSLLKIDLKQITHLIGTGGNCDRFAKFSAMIDERDESDSINFDKLSEILQNLSELNLEERIEEFKIDADRADVIIPAGVFLVSIMENLNISNLMVPAVGLRHGILWKMIENLYIS